MTGRYVRKIIRGHKFTTDGFRYVHRVLMAEKIGRRLREYEVVHHKDHDKSNNDLANLELTTRRAHARMHTHTLSPEARADISKRMIGNTNPKGHKRPKRVRKAHSEENRRRWRDGVYDSLLGPRT